MSDLIPVFTVNPRKVRSHTKSPHQLPQLKDECEEEIYQNELWEASKELESLLVSAGFSSSRVTTIDSEYDFYMNDDLGEFRMLSFEIKNPKMATKELLIKISRWLQSREPDYSVFVTNDYEDSLELFMLVVTQDIIFGELEDASTASRMGFDPQSKLIGPIS